MYTLDTLGYNTMELLLTPLQFGIPNSRLRYYLLAKWRPKAFKVPNEPEKRVWRHIPGQGVDWSDPRDASDDLGLLSGVTPLREFLDPNGTDNQFNIPDRILEKWGRLFDIVLPAGKRTCCFTRGEL